MKPFEYVKDEGGISFLGYVQRWTERLVHGCNIFCQSFRKWQLGRWGLASLPWQHNSGEFQNHASLLDQLCICTVCVSYSCTNLGVISDQTSGSWVLLL